MMETNSFSPKVLYFSITMFYFNQIVFLSLQVVVSGTLLST